MAMQRVESFQVQKTSEGEGRPMVKLSAYPVLLWCAVFSSLLGAFQFGYHLGVLNTCLHWVAVDLDFDETKGGSVVVSAALVGAAVGALLAGQFADAVGPKKALVINNVSLIVGCVLCAWAPGGLWAAIIGRILAGLGAGAASLYVPRYLAEIAPIAIRGGIATLNQVFICTGILIAYVVGLPYASNDTVILQIGSHEISWWRGMLAIGIIPAAVQMATLSWMPESPVWLEWKKKKESASAAKVKLWGNTSYAPLEEEVNGSIENGLDVEGEEQGVVQSSGKGWSELLEPKYRRIMLLTTLIPLFQQLSGVNTCILYSSQVFKEAGLSKPVLGSIIMGCVQFVATVSAVALMDKAGRRLLILLSHAGMGSCFLVIAIVSFIPGLQDAEAIVTLIFLQLYIIFFGLGVGPICWCYLPEILPDNIKGRGASLGTCINWVFTFLVGLSFPIMLKALKVGGSYFVYSIFNLVAFLFCFVYMVETKQKSMNQIQRELIVAT